MPLTNAECCLSVNNSGTLPFITMPQLSTRPSRPTAPVSTRVHRPITAPAPALLSDSELAAAIARVKARAHDLHRLKTAWERKTFVPDGWAWM